jgi:Sulfotransferase family
LLVFHHIPKTAGSTLLDALGRQYADEDIFQIDATNPKKSFDDFMQLSVEQRNSFQIIMGHLANYFYMEISRPYKLMTFVREPTDQFISTYHYIKRSKHNRYHFVVNGMKDISEYLDYRVESGHTNMQTKHLLGYTDINNSGNPLSISASILKEEMIAKAKQIDFLFSTEIFDECLLHLQKKMNWKAAPYYKILNKTKGRPRREEYDGNFLNRVIELNSIDLALYQMSQEWCRLNLVGENGYRIMKFRCLNRLYSMMQ